NKANEIAIKVYEYIYKMFKYIGTLGFIVTLLIPFIFPSISNNDTIIYPVYYKTTFFFINIIFNLALIAIGIFLKEYKEKYKEKENFPYAAFWLFILMTYIASILIYYNK
ncbi:hypothetical protein ACWIVY_04815, partial [Ursidibacter sp. B-7004-1]